jgi:hypothetical protein
MCCSELLMFGEKVKSEKKGKSAPVDKPAMIEFIANSLANHYKLRGFTLAPERLRKAAEDLFPIVTGEV